MITAISHLTFMGTTFGRETLLRHTYMGETDVRTYVCMYRVTLVVISPEEVMQ